MAKLGIASTQTPPNSTLPIVISHSRDVECTVPQTGGAFVNFFSKDTTTFAYEGALIFDCSADLTNSQTTVNTKTGKAGKKGPIAHPTVYTTRDYACAVPTTGSTVLPGEGISIAYPDGEFIETCFAGFGG